MHSKVAKCQEDTGEDGQTDNVVPHRKRIETEGAEYGCSRNFNVKAEFMINQGEIADFVDNECFESVMKDRKLLKISTLPY